MLTLDILRSDATLTAFPEETLNRIVELSRNDETSVLGTKIGELHGKYDADVLSVTGIAKMQGEKSYDYMKRVLSQFKEAADSTNQVKAELTAANTKIADLEAKIAAGGDDAIKQQLNDAKAQVAQLQQQLSTKESEFETVRADLQNQVRTVKIDTAFQAATAGLKFKAGISDGVIQMILSSAKNEVLAKATPDFAEDGALVFRGQDGQIMRNASNGLSPYTFSELLLDTSLKDIVDTGRKQAGGGTKASAGGAPVNTDIDFSGVKTQVDADEAIANYLLGQGLTRDSEEFAARSMQLRTDNKIDQLPIR